MGDLQRLKSLDDVTLADVDALRLILRGGSVIDWHRLNFETEEDVRAFIRNHELDPDSPSDIAYLQRIQAQAIEYLKRNFSFAIPKPIQNASFEELLMVASGSGHRQQCACTVLKATQIINHMNGRELLFQLPLSDRDLFHLVEEKVYRIVGKMLNAGMPIAQFVGGRKNLDSMYTKLLSKPDASTVALYDKLRFRIVTKSRDDLLPVLLYLSERLFPFNYVLPNESTNTIFHFRTLCEEHPHLKNMVEEFQGRLEDTLIPGDNVFSAPDYQTIQFVTEVPVRVPAHIMDSAPSGSASLGSIVYMLCEIQLMDSDSEEANESGEANHEAYKLRQREAVFRRLRLGAREPSDPKTGTR